MTDVHTDASTSGTTAARTAAGRFVHPAFQRVAEKRAADLQLRVADGITAFAGSMTFVYLHAVVFAVWMLVFEKSPWPTLTLIVSLEAIFLSTFVMIGQNRQASFQQAKADHDFVASEQELHANTELTRLIHQLTTEIHSRMGVAEANAATAPATGAGAPTTAIAGMGPDTVTDPDAATPVPPPS
jgi:uncharacterized membrane protein